MNKKETKVINVAAEDQVYDLSEPEKELMIAILKSAVNDLQKSDKADQQRARRFFLNQEEDYLFSFLSICEVLAIMPEKIIEQTGLAEDQEFMNSYRKQYQIFI